MAFQMTTVFLSTFFHLGKATWVSSSQWDLDRSEGSSCQEAPHREGVCCPFLYPAAWAVDVVTSRRESRSPDEPVELSQHSSPRPAISYCMKEESTPILMKPLLIWVPGIRGQTHVLLDTADL